MKKIVILLPVLILINLPVIFAQNESDKEVRVRIVEREVDENGNVVEKVKELVGEEAEKYVEEHGEMIETEKQIKITLDEEDISGDAPVKESKKIKIKIQEDGVSKVIEWDGTGEMPAEMKEVMKEHEMMFIDEEGNQKTLMENGEEDKEIEWREKKVIKKKMKSDHEGRLDHNWHQKHRSMQKGNPNKARLGVRVEEENGKVYVVEVMPDTPAERAGFSAGDVIVKVDDTDIDSVDRLLAEMGTLDPGDKVQVVLQINGATKKLKVKL